MPTEQFANNYSSTLSGAITAGDTSLVVASAAGAPATGNFRLLIDSEIIIVGAVSGTTFSSLTRGAEGTAGASHADGATVTHVFTAGALAAAQRTFHGIAEYASPPSTGWTWDNQGGATVDWTYGFGHLDLPKAGTGALRGIYRTAPSTPYKVRVALLHDFFGPSMDTGLECSVTFGFRDSSGKVVVSGLTIGGSSTEWYYNIDQWTSATSFSSTLSTYGPRPSVTDLVIKSPRWLEIEDDGTNMTFRISLDGVYFKDRYSTARTTFFGAGGPTQIFVGGNANGTAVVLDLLSYEEIPL